ncbi:MAG: response regulator [Calditrichaeota bacterium]|nr:response regulator [Calditrichota bacterium]
MGAKILIVDDNPNVLRLLNITLSRSGKDYEIIEAENGEKAFELANKEKPDLIISDVMMPQMDGIELCWMIRENSEIPLVPFIFLTSFDDPEMEIRGFRAGADEYLSKPIDRKQLLQRVEELLARTKNLKKIEDTGERQKGFSGDLKDLSLVEVVQMLNLNKKTGVLTVTGKINGTVYIKNGQLWYAESGGKKGEEAMYELVALDEGTFQFQSKPVKAERNIQNSTMNVIMEACRIMDEARHGQQSKS